MSSATQQQMNIRPLREGNTARFDIYYSVTVIGSQCVRVLALVKL
jgi:hypothetical protein